MHEQKKDIITIAGRPGSGKSTTAKIIAKQLGYIHFSSGDFFRAIANERGQDVLTSNLEAEKEAGIPVIDELVDQRLRELGAQGNQMVVDSRMAWHWMPYSFKIFLDLDMQTAAARIIANTTPERMQAERIPENTAEYAESLGERLKSESRRYTKIYNADPYEMANYDLVINTKTDAPEVVAAFIIGHYCKWQES